MSNRRATLDRRWVQPLQARVHQLRANPLCNGFVSGHGFSLAVELLIYRLVILSEVLTSNPSDPLVLRVGRARSRRSLCSFAPPQQRQHYLNMRRRLFAGDLRLRFIAVFLTRFRPPFPRFIGAAFRFFAETGLRFFGTADFCFFVGAGLRFLLGVGPRLVVESASAWAFVRETK